MKENSRVVARHLGIAVIVSAAAVGSAAATPAPVKDPPTAPPVSGTLGPCVGKAAGVCVDTTKATCSSNVLQSNACPGGASVKCCPLPGVPVVLRGMAPVPATAPADPLVSGDLGPCSGVPSGVCIDTTKTACPSKTLRADGCPGASTNKCCVGVQPPAPAKSLGSCSGTGFVGTCIDATRTRCSGELRRGVCAGSSAIKCCVAPPTRR